MIEKWKKFLRLKKKMVTKKLIGKNEKLGEEVKYENIYEKKRTKWKNIKLKMEKE